MSIEDKIILKISDLSVSTDGNQILNGLNLTVKNFGLNGKSSVQRLMGYDQMMNQVKTISFST